MHLNKINRRPHRCAYANALQVSIFERRHRRRCFFIFRSGIADRYQRPNAKYRNDDHDRWQRFLEVRHDTSGAMSEELPYAFIYVLSIQNTRQRMPTGVLFYSRIRSRRLVPQHGILTRVQYLFFRMLLIARAHPRRGHLYARRTSEILRLRRRTA